MESLKAKARAYGLAEEPGLIELASEAEIKILYARPTPMDRASALIAEYDAKLRLRAKVHGKA